MQLCKSIFLELDRHLHEVLAPRLDELGLRRYALTAWPSTAQDPSPQLLTPEHCLAPDAMRASAQES
jgi:hypothetical protein